jgi:hypothetical protein
VYLMAGIGVAEFARLLARVLASPPLRTFVRNGTPAIAFLAMWLAFGPSLRALPGGYVDPSGVYHWPKHFSIINTKDVSFVPGWTNWNFRGYENESRPGGAKFGGYAEYYAINQEMMQIGSQFGCGRAMWEYEGGQESYGTTMAMMLLPFWSDSCITSMEGLYFEASSTTPYHFLNQSALSFSPSRAQSHINYPNFDVGLGVKQLQLMGVKYYMATSDEAIKQASENPDLTEITESAVGPWHIYLVKGSDLVQPLAYQPVVYSNVNEQQKSWLPPAVDFFNNPAEWDVLRAATGPDSWQRWASCITADQPSAVVGEGDTPEGCTPPKTPVTPAVVTNITSSDDSVSFDVDRVGSPVLVKVSYFPNWKVSGAEGPYRVTPNLMVVIPTSNHVRLHYGYVGIDYVANGLTLLGIIAVLLLFRARVREQSRPLWDPVGRWLRRVKQSVTHAQLLPAELAEWAPPPDLSEWGQPAEAFDVVAPGALDPPPE